MIEVVAAIIHNSEGKILIARRKQEKSMGGYWEFPGGKIEEGEIPEQSLIRELMEEMNIKVQVRGYFDTNVHDYGGFKIKLIAYMAEIQGGSMLLKDHDRIEWAAVEGLDNYSFTPADIPFVEKLQGKR